MQNHRFILAIESSCDDSALTLLNHEGQVIVEEVYRQTASHEPYGGVVPDIASREHTIYLPQLLKKIHPILTNHPPTEIAVTIGPGLPGSLGVGVAFAQAISIQMDLPLYGVNHLQGHAFSPLIPLLEKTLENKENFTTALQKHLPHLGILVSGSNTLLFAINPSLEFEILAETVDDAMGEALDKGAKLLGMPYPGGPLIEKLAKAGDANRFKFPQAFPENHTAKFSYSGLKTSLRYLLEKMDENAFEESLPHLCASYQKAAFEPVIKKAHYILKNGNFKSIGLSGGVANNDTLRTLCQNLAEKTHLPLLLPHKRHTTDNATMIAFAHWLKPAQPLSGNILQPSMRLCT